MTILNTKIRDFEWEVIAWVDSQCKKTLNQVVELVLGSDHPPFTTDPRIIEFIKREAETLAEHTHKEAVIQAKHNAKQTYDAAREQADALHAKDLEAIREHMDKALTEALTRSKIEIAAFKVDLKAQHAQCKANLKQDAILAKRTPRKPCPDPINTSRSQQNASCSTSCYPSPSHSVIEITEPMALDTNEPLDLQNENSPTPTSAVPVQIPHVPEAPSKSSKLDDIISMMHKGFKNMGNIINLKLEKVLALINYRLQQLEGAPCQPDDFFLNWGQGDVDIDSGLTNYTTPEQQDLLHIQCESQEFEKQYAAYEEEEEQYIQEETTHARNWKTATEEEK
jgi:hypothetical protein